MEFTKEDGRSALEALTVIRDRLAPTVFEALAGPLADLSCFVNIATAKAPTASELRETRWKE